MSQIPDFTETEPWTLCTGLTERYGAPVDVQRGDGEVRLNPESSSLTTCPVADSAVGGANFVIFKIGETEYRSPFYYRARDPFSTGRDDYDNLGECVISLFQTQAGHERKQYLKAGIH